MYKIIEKDGKYFFASDDEKKRAIESFATEAPFSNGIKAVLKVLIEQESGRGFTTLELAEKTRRNNLIKDGRKKDPQRVMCGVLSQFKNRLMAHIGFRGKSPLFPDFGMISTIPMPDGRYELTEVFRKALEKNKRLMDELKKDMDEFAPD